MEPGTNQAAKGSSSSQTRGKPMTARRIAATTAFASVLLVAGCAGAFRNPSYYSLSIAPELKPGLGAIPHPVTIEVRQFETPAYLRQGRIVYREHPDQVGVYEYHRWAVDPGAAVWSRLQNASSLPGKNPGFSGGVRCGFCDSNTRARKAWRWSMAAKPAA